MVVSQARYWGEDIDDLHSRECMVVGHQQRAHMRTKVGTPLLSYAYILRGCYDRTDPGTELKPHADGTVGGSCLYVSPTLAC